MDLIPIQLVFFALVLVLSCHATETPSTQDHDIQLQTHLNQVPNVDAVNYYNKNVNRAFRLFRPDLETDDEKQKEKYGIEFIPTLIAKQLLPALENPANSSLSASPLRLRRDAGAIRFGDSDAGSIAEANPKHFGSFGTNSAAEAHSHSQTLTASLNFGPFGASLTTTNIHGGSHAHAQANELGGFGGLGGSQASANANAGSFGNGGGPWAPPAFGPPPYYGHYGSFPVQGHGHYGSNYGYGGYYPFGQVRPGYGSNPNAVSPQYHQQYPYGGLYAGGPAETHYPAAYHGYGRGANTKLLKSSV